MHYLEAMRTTLQSYANPTRALAMPIFFKASKGNVFLGVGASIIRTIAKQYYTVSLAHVLHLMQSTIHDEKALAYAILRIKFKKGSSIEQDEIFTFYLDNREHICDWDSVDDSAPHIVGPYLLHRDKTILYTLAASERIWDRRIAIVSTLHFIRQGTITETLAIARILIQDTHDLIHKAVGWALREVGKKDVAQLQAFLKEHHTIMPRTMLRYAIERFAPHERAQYLMKKKGR